MAFLKPLISSWGFMSLMTVAFLVSAISVSSFSAFAAAPTISSERVQLRTLADGSVAVTVSATVEDLDGLDGVRVTVDRPGVFPRSYPLQRGLYSSTNDICDPGIFIPLTCTLDSYSVTMGTEFVSDAQRAGDYVITVDDGVTQVSTTVTLPSGLVALAAGGSTTIDLTDGDLERPRVSIPPIPGAFGYRISIQDDSDSISRSVDGVTGPGLSLTPSIRVGNVSRLETGKFYRLSIDAFDDSEVGLSNRRSESADICYDPATGATNIPCFAAKDVHLITEADGTVVMQAISRVLDSNDLAYLKNPCEYLTIQMGINPCDTSPAPVPVAITRGSFGPFPLTASILRDVDIDSDVTDRFTSARNPLDASEIPVDQRAGDYNFRAEDSTGNVVTVTRNFPTGLAPFPPAGSLTIDTSTGQFTPTAIISPVPGASNYRVVVFNDTDSTRKNFDNLPGGTLAETPSVEIFPGVIEPNKAYRIHMEAYNNETFSTSTVRSRSESRVYDPSGLDSDGDGIQSTIDGQFAGGFVDQSGTPSNNFTNEHLGGIVFGSIIDRADLDVVVVVPPDPSSGLRLGAAGGFGTARVNACLPTVDIKLTDRDAIAVNCGSLVVEVLDGTVEFLLGGNGTLIAPGGARLTISETSPGQYSVVNSATSFVPLTLLLDGQQITAQPGSSGVSLPSVVIKPGDGPNCVNPKSKGVVPVAILGGTTDVTTIVRSSLQLDDDANAATLGISPAKVKIADVNGDAISDLILHFKTQELNSAGLISEGRTLFITGQLTDGATLVGSDVIFLSNGPTCH